MSDPTETVAPADTATAIVVDRPAATESTTTEPTTDPNQQPQTNSKPRIDVAVVIDMVRLMIPFHSFIYLHYNSKVVVVCANVNKLIG